MKNTTTSSIVNYITFAAAFTYIHTAGFNLSEQTIIRDIAKGLLVQHPQGFLTTDIDTYLAFRKNRKDQTEEKTVARNIAAQQTPEQKEIAALKAEIESLKKAAAAKSESAKKSETIYTLKPVTEVAAAYNVKSETVEKILKSGLVTQTTTYNINSDNVRVNCFTKEQEEKFIKLVTLFN